MNTKFLIDNLRCIPDFPKKGINFRDVTTLYKNGECVQMMLDELERIYKNKGITIPPALDIKYIKPKVKALILIGNNSLVYMYNKLREPEKPKLDINKITERRKS